MLTTKFPTILAALLLSQTSFLNAESISLLVDSNAAFKLAGGFLFTEGPASDENGNIFYNDLPLIEPLNGNIPVKILPIEEEVEATELIA